MNTVIEQTPLQVWQSYIHSMQHKTDDWHDLLADDLTFTGPVMQVQGKENFIKATSDFFRTVKHIDMIRHAVGENLVTAEAKIKVMAPSGKEITMNLAEFYEIDKGKIKSIKVFYDSIKYRKEFGVE